MCKFYIIMGIFQAHKNSEITRLIYSGFSCIVMGTSSENDVIRRFLPSIDVERQMLLSTDVKRRQTTSINVILVVVVLIFCSCVESSRATLFVLTASTCHQQVL